jgi:sodium transport system ATP-binding protein
MLDMQPLLDRRTDGFSQGERMKTALARALVHDPANIILDEPTNGLDVLATRACATPCAGCATSRASASSSPPTSCRRWSGLCDQVVLVSHGRTVAEGTVAELCARAGQDDFEETFVQLAFHADERHAGSAA